MQHADFVPLHLHSEYSLLDGAIKIDELVDLARSYRMPAVAITDHGNLFGAIEFYKKASKAGIKPIIGCEVYVAPQSRFDRTRSAINHNLPEEAAFHLILLARDSTGYRNLTTLVTKAYLEGFYYKPRIDKDLLQQYSGGLLGLSACLKGEVPYYLQHGQTDKAREVALAYKRILGPDNFYLELQHNGLPEQEEVNGKLLELSQDLHIPVVATNDCHYLRKEDAKAHDILLCIQTGKTVKDAKRLRFETENFYFRSPEDMRTAFQDTPDAVRNTIVIAERCNVDFSLHKTLLPRYDVPEGTTPDRHLEELAMEGLKVRCGGPPPQNYVDRLRMELQVIRKMGYASYFLIVWDFISYAKRKSIPVGPGRGSAAGSLVAYSLGITEIDPIKYRLLFERFLNPERVSMPDIDVDFCKDRRQEVLAYVADKYGHDRVAQIITFGTMASRAAVRDVGRVLDLPYAEVDRIAKLVPAGPEVKSLDDALKHEPQLRDLYDTNEQVRELLDIAKRLEGLSRHASTHAAGVVIAPEPLNDYVALYKHPSEQTVTTQCDMKAVEDIGLLKFDFLGLKTLTILEKTLQYIRQSGRTLSLSDLSLEDAATYRLLSSGEATGIFQLESSGMRDILRRMQPNRFEDLIALVALYRPGPMAWIDDFIKRKRGDTPVTYEMPELREILDETYGIMLYQEQVMMIANRIANFTMGQADILRKAMGKKDIDAMDEQKEHFIRGAARRGIPEKKARRLFETMEPFARYGFNKSHSAAYAYIAYQTAYFKTHYPVEFMTANLSADMDDTGRIVTLINDCRAMSIITLPPDINESEREFKIVGTSVRFGLEAVKGVGTSAIESILTERASGFYTSFDDFMKRIDSRRVNKKVVESLVKAGAFDSLYQDPPALGRAAALETLESPHHGNGGLSLFGDAPQAAPSVQAWDEATLLGYERDALGFYISGHPLTRYRRTLSSSDILSVALVDSREDRADIAVAGIVNDVRTRARDKGITAYLTIEDETGAVEVLVFPDTYRKTGELLRKQAVLVVRGQVSKTEKGSKVIARDIRDLSDMEVMTRYEVDLCCEDPDAMIRKLKDIRMLMDHRANGKETATVSFRVHLPDYCVVLSSPLQPASNFLTEMARIPGGSVRVV